MKKKFLSLLLIASAVGVSSCGNVSIQPADPPIVYEYTHYGSGVCIPVEDCFVATKASASITDATDGGDTYRRYGRIVASIDIKKVKEFPMTCEIIGAGVIQLLNKDGGVIDEARIHRHSLYELPVGATASVTGEFERIMTYDGYTGAKEVSTINDIYDQIRFVRLKLDAPIHVNKSE